MKSRLLLRLEAEIKACKDPFEVDCLRAERACYLARIGEVDEATAVVADLHRKYGHRQAAIAVWSSLVEAMVSHFSDMGPLAHDRIRRAHALSTATGLTRLQALSAAWLAHMCYLRTDMAAMKAHLVQALALARPDDHTTLARANLVVAQALHAAARLDLALPWYSRARVHASKEGDDASISALMHNMAWLRATNMRQAVFCRATEVNEEVHALTSAESTLHFDLLVGSTSLGSLVPLLRAQILSLESKPSEALEIYEQYLVAAIRQGMGRLESSLLADQAWCRVQLGQNDDALSDARAAEARLDPVSHADDRAPAHSRLSQVFEMLGLSVDAKKHADQAGAAWLDHTQLQAEIIKLVGPLREDGTSKE